MFEGFPPPDPDHCISSSTAYEVFTDSKGQNTGAVPFCLLRDSHRLVECLRRVHRSLGSISVGLDWQRIGPNSRVLKKQ